MKTTLPSVRNQVALRRAKAIGNETAHGLAADLIERGIQSRFDELHGHLLQIADSGLIGRNDDFRMSLDKLCRDAEGLESRLCKIYPASSHGGARKRRLQCRDLAAQVDLYRQEQFWLGEKPESFLASEVLIRDLFRFYAEADFLMRNIDREQPDYRVENRGQPPMRTPNPYEAIDRD